MQDEPVVEMTSTADTLETALTVYRISPGGLYCITIPAWVTDDEFDAFKATFAPEKAVLDPPATFLFFRHDLRLSAAPDGFLHDYIERASRLLAERAATKETTGNG